MAYAEETQPSFTLGDPAIVCRWRLCQGRLPMENRHLRALSRRKVGGEPVSRELIAWAKQHIEWTLEDGSAEHPDGVLMLVIDSAGKAAMTVGPYTELSAARLADLVGRATVSSREADETGVGPESLWIARDGTFYWGIEPDCAPSGAATLVEDLAKTLGLPVRRVDGLPRKVASGEVEYDEAFLVSDEHGVVLATDAAGEQGERFRSGYEKLMESYRRKH